MSERSGRTAKKIPRQHYPMNAVGEHQTSTPISINCGNRNTNKRRPTAAAAQSYPHGTPGHRWHSRSRKRWGRGKVGCGEENVKGKKSGAPCEAAVSMRGKIAPLVFPWRFLPHMRRKKKFWLKTYNSPEGSLLSSHAKN